MRTDAYINAGAPVILVKIVRSNAYAVNQSVSANHILVSIE